MRFQTPEKLLVVSFLLHLCNLCILVSCTGQFCRSHFRKRTREKDTYTEDTITYLEGHSYYQDTLKVSRMSVSEVTTENGKISCKTTEGSVININISQRSFWDSLADNVNTLRKSQTPGETPPAPRPPTSSNYDGRATALPVIVGVSQFPLGVICIAISIITLAADVELSIVTYTSALFWMGIPFIISGVLEVVSYAKNNPIWVFLSFVCELLNFCVSIAGLVLTANLMNYGFYGYYYSQDPCQRLLEASRPRNYESNNWQGNSYNTYTNDNNSNGELIDCQRIVNQTKDLKHGFLIILLVIGTWGVISSFIAVIYRLKSWCKPCSAYEELAKENNEPTEKDSPYTITV